MLISHKRLTSLFVNAYRQIVRGRRSVPVIEVEFYPYTELRHTIRERSKHVYVRISDIFYDAPLEVHRALAYIMVAILFKKRASEEYNRIYREYTRLPRIRRARSRVRRRRGYKVILTAQGHYYNLETMFERLNRRYFGGSIKKPALTWSKRNTISSLGNHDPEHNAITISRVLDSASVPCWFVEYILYHEMLHIKHPPRFINGRYRYHTKDFEADERRFLHYKEAIRWYDRFIKRQTTSRRRAA